MIWTEYVAECVGTFIFVSVVLISRNPIIIGLALVVILSALGAYSKQSVNPAVSLGYLMGGDLSVVEFFGYIGGQFLAAALAFLFFKHVYLSNISTYGSK